MDPSLLTIEFETEPTGVLAQLNSLIGEDGSVEVNNLFYIEDGLWLELLTIISSKQIDLEEALQPLSRVSIFHLESIPPSSRGQHRTRCVIFAREPHPFIVEFLLRSHVIPNRVTLRNDRVRIAATLKEWEDFQELGTKVEQQFGTFELLRVEQTARPGHPLNSGQLYTLLTSKLTDSQLDILETAYTMGYFSVPREASAQEVAEELSIHQSTFSEEIRTAEKAFLDLVFSST